MKTAVITGASSGIGLSLGKEMSRDGYVVYGLSRTAPDTDTIIHVPCDVTQESSVRDATSKVVEKSGRIDVLVACAGFGVAGSIEHTKEADMIRQMDVNVYGVVRTIQASLPCMRTQEADANGVRGKIIIIGSLASELPLPFQGMYSMGKAALHSMTGSLLNEIYPYNIEVTCILPGDVNTNFTQKRKTDWDGLDVYPDMQKILDNAADDENTGSDVQTIAHEIAQIIQRKHLAPSYTLDRLSFWWLPKIKEFPIAFYTENQLLTKSCPKVGSSRGTKMGQNLLKTYLAIFFHDVHVIKDLCYSFAKVHNSCETNEGIPLNLSFAVHFSATCTDNGIFG